MKHMVQFQNVTKKFKMYAKPSDKLKDLFLSNEKGEFHHALRGVSFNVDKGEIVGVIGLNGSGKSTLSNLIAGVTMPSSGEVKLEGKAALIAISSGLSGQLTGLENIELKGLMLGLTKQQIKEITPKVIAFADIGKFIHQPVKTYSSGMKSRLGFAISVHIDPDILVIDEALSVGDQTFTQRCLDKMNEFKESGKTIFFISHSLSQVKSFCAKALWIHYGEVRGYGEVNEIVDEYQQFLNMYNKLTSEERNRLREESINKQSIPKEESGNLDDNGLQQTEDLLHRSRKYKDSTRYKHHFKKKRTKIIIAAVAGCLVAGSVAAYKGITVLDTKENEAKVIETTTKDSPPKKLVIQTKMLVVTTKIGTVRAAADLTSQQIAQVELGEAFEVLEKKADPVTSMDWLKVKLPNEKIGWISSAISQEYVLEERKSQKKEFNSLTEFLKVLGLNNTLVNHAKYVNKPLDFLKENNKERMISQTKVGNESFINYKGVQFVAENQQVTQVNYSNLNIPIKNSESQLGAPFFVDDKEGIRLFVTDKYSITVSTLHNQIVAVSVKVTNNTSN
jgi:teichoic acid transport system ATP-binding protein